jgi:aminoglycoside/choline kinase family phosphotransferase
MGAFPRAADELTADWLTAVLREEGRLSTGRVSSVVQSGVGEQGQTGEVVKLTLGFDGDRGSAPSSVVAKLPPPHAEIRQQMHALGLYEREVRFYQCFGERAGISVPHCHFAEVDTETGDFVVLLEDMSQCRVGDFWRSNVDDVRVAVDALAGMQARWWNSEELREHSAWLRQHDDADYNVTLLGSVLQGVLPVVEERFPEHFTGYLRELGRRLADGGWAALVTWDDAEPFTLVHGDFHPKQLFFAGDGGRFAVFDWQGVCAGWPGADLARILATGLRPPELAQHRDELLGRYATRLAEHGIEQGAQAIEHSVQLGLLITLYITIFAAGTSDMSILEEAATARGVNYLDRMWSDIGTVLEDFRAHEALDRRQ